MRSIQGKDWHDDDACSRGRAKAVSPEWKDAVLHARISIGENQLWAADIQRAEPMRSAYLTLRVDNDIEAERIYSVLL